MALSDSNATHSTSRDRSTVDGTAAASTATDNGVADRAVAVESGTSIRYDQGWLSSFLRPVLIVVLATCLAVALLNVLRQFVPSLSTLYTQVVLLLGIAAALIGCVTTTWLAQPAQRMRRTAAYRLAEIGLLLALTRLAVWVVAGNMPTLEALFTAPLSSLFDAPFVIAAIVVGVTWMVATELTGSLLAMALQPDEVEAAEAGTVYRDTVRPNYTDRNAILNGFATQWVIGGIVLVVLAASANVGFSSNGFLAITRQNIAPANIASVVIYFLVGLMLLSQGQLAILRARWALEQTPTRNTILQYWPAYAVAVLVGIGALAALMPFGGTYWLARAISAVFGAIYFVVFFIFQLFGVLFALIMSLFAGGEETQMPAQPPLQPMMQPPPEAPPSEFLELAGSTVFWMLAVLILGYAAYVYFTDKGIRFGWLTWIWNAFRGQWRQLTAAVGLWQRSRVDDGSRDGVGGKRRSRRWFPWRRRPNSPDALARFYYHAMLNEAKSKGIAREKSETPLDFAPRLSSALPVEAEASDAVDELTGAFIRVRYAKQHLDESDVPVLEQVWKKIRRTLRL